MKNLNQTDNVWKKETQLFRHLIGRLICTKIKDEVDVEVSSKTSIERSNLLQEIGTKKKKKEWKRGRVEEVHLYVL